MTGFIKKPTYRKVLNRGYVPVRWYTRNGGWQYGWQWKTSGKWAHVYLPNRGNRRVRLDDPSLESVDKSGSPMEAA